jgi:histone H3/H4
MKKNMLPCHTVGKMMKSFGAQRVSYDAKEALSGYLEGIAEKTVKNATRYAAHAKRKTITAEDIRLAVNES